MAVISKGLVVFLLLCLGAHSLQDGSPDPRKNPSTGPWGKGTTTESCCKGSDEQLCNNYRYQGTEMMECFGASGDDCNGIPQLRKGSLILKELGRAWGSNVLQRLGSSVQVRKNADGTMDVPTSVGSIFHDTCCVAHPSGLFCNKYNQPYTSVLLKKTNKCHCGMEWRKAVLSLLTGRWWYTKYDAQHRSNHSPTNKPLPPTILPVSLTRWDSQASSYGLNEVVATSKLRAPPGTRLDCPGTDSRCLLGFLKFNKVADDNDPALTVVERYKLQLNSKVKEALKRVDQSTTDGEALLQKGFFARLVDKVVTFFTSLFGSSFLEVSATDLPDSLTLERRDRLKPTSLPSSASVEMDPMGVFTDSGSDWNTIRASADWKATTADSTGSQVASRSVSKVAGYEAGDSHYCQSGKFKSIHFRLHLLRGWRRFGVCA